MRTLGFPYPSNPATFVVIVTLAHKRTGPEIVPKKGAECAKFPFC